MTDAKPLFSLVADVGGTNTRVALADGVALRPGSIERFRNAEFAGLNAVLKAYLQRQGHPDCDAVCAAVAGPVDGDHAVLTNLDWQISAESLAEAAQAEHAALLNDLQAQGHGVPHIASDKLSEVRAGEPTDSPDPRLVIGVGTGFNIAPIYPTRDGALVTAAEAGHAALPVANADDLDLAEFIGARRGFADVEEALSGRGLEALFAWVTDRAGRPTHRTAAEIAQGLQQSDDDDVARTARVFARMLALVASDLALIHLPYGGIYFSGGVVRAFAPSLMNLGFNEVFCQKGRFSNVLEKFPVHVIEDDFAALAGCAAFLRQEVANSKQSA